jgi:hypothetical protein
VERRFSLLGKPPFPFKRIGPQGVDSLFGPQCTTMDFHCNSIVIPMPEKDESKEFSITLPLEAIEMIENGLIPWALYGKRRATICRALILRALNEPAVQANVEAGRAKASAVRGAATE